MRRGKFKVILDTNLWISFLIRPTNFPILLEAIATESIQIIYSQELLDELIEVSSRPKLQKLIAPDVLNEVVSFLLAKGKLKLLPKKRPQICRDPKDNYLLALAITSRADYLVSGDKDLLILKRVRKTSILSYTEFQNIVNLTP